MIFWMLREAADVITDYGDPRELAEERRFACGPRKKALDPQA